jgi:formylglycine-generating enzyme required for sulfatase activity
LQNQIRSYNLALIEKLKRKFNVSKIYDELNQYINSGSKKGYEKLVEILLAFQNSGFEVIISKEILDLVIDKIYQDISKLATSESQEDKIQYIHITGSIIQRLELSNILYLRTFIDYLNKIVINRRLNFELRKEAFFEIILLDTKIEQIKKIHSELSKQDFMLFVHELNSWINSKDLRKKTKKVEFDNKWSIAISHGNIDLILELFGTGLFDVNYRNISDFSLLQLSVFSNRKNIIDWLIANPNFDFNAQNRFGYTELDQLILYGRSDIVDLILKKHPDVKFKNILLKERKSDKSPIIEFVRIEPGRFKMRTVFLNDLGLHWQSKEILKEITNPFAILSIHTTQKIYKFVIDLLKENIKENDSKIIDSEFLKSKDFIGNNLPMTMVSYSDVITWLNGLNELSNLDHLEIQDKLKSIFPGHSKGDEYRLPTSTEWEYAARLGGVVQDEFIYNDLRSYAVYSINSENNIKTVGSLKPVFYNGLPIYDIVGNVWSWTSEPEPTYHNLNKVKKHLLRGGSWRSPGIELSLDSKINYENDNSHFK